MQARSTSSSRLAAHSPAAVTLAALFLAQSGGFVASASAMRDTSDPSRFVCVARADAAQPEVSVAVSGGAVEIDGWRYKALYRGNNGAVEVIGFLAARVSQEASITPIGAVWYCAPELPSGPWASEAFPEIPASTAAAILKARFQIPDAQDVLWDVGELPPVDASCATLQSETVIDGLLASDPLGAVLAPLAPDSKAVMLSALVGIGYPAVDAKPEAVDESERFHMLDMLQSVFQDWLSTWVPMSGAEHLLIQAHLPKQIDMDAVSQRWRNPIQSIPSPCPPAWWSDWEPLDPSALCDCETQGPYANCQQVTYSVEGTVEITLPWPPPTGTKITLRGSVSGTTAVLYCGWGRICHGAARRTYHYSLPPDCEPRQRDYFALIAFERWSWNPPQFMPSCADMTCQPWRPAGVPPASQDCGLGIPVQTVP